MKLTFSTILFIIVVLLILYLSLKMGVDHEYGPASVVHLFS